MPQIVVLLLFVVAGCATNPAVGAFRAVRPEAQTDCAASCAQMGMQLGAVVLIMNSEGCVCEPMSPQGYAPRSMRPSTGAAAAAGGVLAAEEEKQRQEDEEQQQLNAELQQQPVPAAPPSSF